jgi:hypothetical protein
MQFGVSRFFTGYAISPAALELGAARVNVNPLLVREDKKLPILDRPAGLIRQRRA